VIWKSSMMTDSQDPHSNLVERLIRDFCASGQNSLHLPTGEPAWDDPLIGTARGDDPLFDILKRDIGPFYSTPLEAFQLAYPELEVTAEHLSVIVYVLPQTEATRTEQSLETEVPAERWARSRFYGEEFNCALHLHLSSPLTAAGFPAVAPERLAEFAYQDSERFGMASNWSERHTA